MELEGRFKILKINTKTQAQNWKTLKPGVIINIVLDIGPSLIGFGKYVMNAKIYVEGTDIYFYDSMPNVIFRINSNFLVEQLK